MKLCVVRILIDINVKYKQKSMIKQNKLVIKI